MKWLSIDTGSTGGKVALFSEDMQLLASFRKDYPTYVDAGPDSAEQDPADWWAVAKAGIAVVLKETHTKVEEIGGIGLSCMTPELLPLDAAGRPLSRAWMFYDRRAARIAQRILREVPTGTFERITANACKDVSYIAKVLYLKEEFSEIYENTASFMQASGYMAYRLTGERTMDSSHGEVTLLVDKQRGDYSDELMNRFGIAREKFPKIIGAHEIVGHVTPAAAAELGLNEGIPVVSGGHDSALSALALGIRDIGDAVLDVGNTGNLIMCMDKAVLCPASDVYRHPVPGKWLFQIYSATIGSAFRWYKEVFGGLEAQAAAERGISEYDYLCQTAAESPAGANGIIFLPFLRGAQQSGAVNAGFLDVTLDHRRQDFTRAVLEGCAMSIRYNMEQMEMCSGEMIGRIIICGGGSKNAFWRQIFADVLNRPLLSTDVTEGAVMGAALLARNAVRGKMEKVQSSGALCLPQISNRVIYDKNYARFKEIFEHEMNRRS